ncbi:MAG: type II toxin-antitoxin system Phd/YefM family antitoxin, partial [Dolichospermum sp.]
IHPLSDFQRAATMFLDKLKDTKTPIVLTGKGQAAAVVQDADSYQTLIDRLELLESVANIRQSINEFRQGEGMPLNQAFAEFKEKYGIPD